MKSLLFSPAAVGALVFVFVGESPSAEESRPECSETDPASLERRLTDIENQMTSALNDLREMRRSLRAQIRVTVFPLKKLDPVDAARQLDDLFGNNSKRTAFEADPKAKSLIVRANGGDTDLVKKALTVLGEELK